MILKWDFICNLKRLSAKSIGSFILLIIVSSVKILLDCIFNDCGNNFCILVGYLIYINTNNINKTKKIFLKTLRVFFFIYI